MSNKNLLDFYEPFEFYETETEDGGTALLYETSEEGEYVLITDVDGNLPEDLDEEIIFALYNGDGAFCWSVSFKDSHQILELLENHPKDHSLIDIVKEYRDSSEYY